MGNFVSLVERIFDSPPLGTGGWGVFLLQVPVGHQQLSIIGRLRRPFVIVYRKKSRCG